MEERRGSNHTSLQEKASAVGGKRSWRRQGRGGGAGLISFTWTAWKISLSLWLEGEGAWLRGRTWGRVWLLWRAREEADGGKHAPPTPSLLAGVTVRIIALCLAVAGQTAGYLGP